MKRLFLGFLMIVGLGVGLSAPVQAAEEIEVEIPVLGQSIYRMYNPNTGEHLYTPSMFEQATLFNLGWKDEGTAWFAPREYVGAAIYRVYNPNAGDHHFTTDVNEIAHLLEVGWHDDRLSFPSATDEGVPIYRLYNPNAKVGAHHFTANGAERDMLVSVGWRYEGISFYADSLN
ncbi:hypothetical protein JZO70_21965 [Enterococcus sp. 669A]|uniref:DUF5648 domain-containing protein n=1 Tax=Candidatus Enterococcus moelleringii TaxID=2815325 RepID=A0ABS3LIG7_9ENTE|nr:hypothetical protein [Enterococcus sp. 669A]MBO1308853.1 hypothetical protein [Enterococcus sp. 669A]